MGDERVQLGRLNATDRLEDANEQPGVGSEGAVCWPVCGTEPPGVVPIVSQDSRTAARI